MSDWKLGRRRGGCAKCEHPFEDGEAHHSILVLTGDEIGRRDCCTGCFADLELADDDVWWRTKHTVAEKKGVQLDLESIHALFDALADREQRGWRELRYLLCLILLRKRRLKVLSVKRIDGEELFVCRRPRHDGELLVHVYDFSAERRGELRDTLQAIFEGADLDELDPDGAPRPGADDAPPMGEGGQADDEPAGADEGEPGADDEPPAAGDEPHAHGAAGAPREGGAPASV